MMKKLISSPVTTIVLFAVAVVLLLTGTIGGARAARISTQEYVSTVSMQDIGVTLLENDKAVAYRNYRAAADGTWNQVVGDEALLKGLVKEGEKFNFSTQYDEKLAVQNSGNIDQYVRVTVYRFWKDAEGNKVTTFDPSLIKLHLPENSPWILDEDASTEERIVLYYPAILAVDQVSAPFVDKIMVDGSEYDFLPSASKTTLNEETGYYEKVTTYEYSGGSFGIEVEVDAVQTHNAAGAILSAWGKKVSVGGDGSLSFQ